MPHLNIEIKARCADLDAVRDVLEAENARFVGDDRQIDTYFAVPNGRLKLREGLIENALIHYERTDQAGPKPSEVTLFKTTDGADLKAILAAALEVAIVVDKRRAIYFLDNVKVHLDRVEGLGTFVEIEAIDVDGTFSAERLHAQCQHYLERFGIAEADLCTHSYSDMLGGG